jgi:RNA-binding motif X-linked protein 2
MTVRSQELARVQKAEFDHGIFDVSQSFHGEFRDCPWIIVRNLSYELSEGDITTMFEQYGTLTSLELLRDKQTGMSKGTSIMAYEDPRSAILAVDNFNGVTLLGRQISVEHLDFKESADSHQTDPRTQIPARLRTDKFTATKPSFDAGSANSTDDEDSA